MSKYSEKKARRIQNAISVAVAITDGTATPPPPPAPPKPAKTTPPPRQQRGVLVDLGHLPFNCAQRFLDAADALDRASALADEMTRRAHRSRQSGEAVSAFGLATTLAPRLRGQALRLLRLPRPATLGEGAET